MHRDLILAVTCLQSEGAHVVAGILAAELEDDEDSEDGHGNTLPNLGCVGDHKTNDPNG